jgi:tetratricopeptide (TPR) repeat protein
MRAGPLALALLAFPALLTAQLPDAEAAFRRGDYVAARTAYERVLATDSLNIRALYRLAVLDSWDGKLSRSLQRLARARRLEPSDADIMVSQAQVLAWAGRLPAAEALYDSVLARFPHRADALAGRARAVAWRGDLDRAEQLWRAALERYPDAAELLIGLAQTLYWKGQAALAETYAARARAAAPGDRAARDLERVVRAALRPEVATTVDGATDSDTNRFVAQEGTVTGSLGGDLRGTLRAGWRRATDPRHRGTSYGAGGSVIAALGKGAVVRAGLGVRHIDPDTVSSTPLTAELGIGLRPGRYAAMSLAYTRTAFDETVGLMRQGLTVDAGDLSVDLSPAPGWSISGGGGGAWLSDGNRRLSAVGAVLGRVAPGLQIGPYARILGYRRPAPGLYFAPNRFSVIEARVVYQWQRSRWGVRADGGLGSQQVSDTSAHQTAWHVGFALSRGWGANNEISLVGSITNSAGATTTAGVRSETFRYRTLGLRFRQGL